MSAWWNSRSSRIFRARRSRRRLRQHTNLPALASRHGLPFARRHGTIFEGFEASATEVMMTPTEHPAIIVPSSEALATVHRPSRKVQALAFLVAAVSDVVSMWTGPPSTPPVGD